MPTAIDFLNAPDAAPKAVDYLNAPDAKPNAAEYLNSPDQSLEGADLKAAQDQATAGILETQRILSTTPGGFIAQSALGKAAFDRERQQLKSPGEQFMADRPVSVKTIAGNPPEQAVEETYPSGEVKYRPKSIVEKFYNATGFSQDYVRPKTEQPYTQLAETMAGTPTGTNLPQVRESFEPIDKLIAQITPEPMRRLSGGEVQSFLNQIATPEWWMGKPLPTTESTPELVGAQPGITANLIAGIQRTAAKNIDFFTSPEGVALLGTQALSGDAQRAIAATFALQMAGSLPEQSLKLATSKDMGEATENAADMLVTSGLAFAAGLHATGHPAIIEAQARGLEQSGAPATAEAVREVSPVVNEVRTTGELQSTVELPPKAEPLAIVGARAEIFNANHPIVAGAAVDEAHVETAAKHFEQTPIIELNKGDQQGAAMIVRNAKFGEEGEKPFVLAENPLTAEYVTGKDGQSHSPEIGADNVPDLVREAQRRGLSVDESALSELGSVRDKGTTLGEPQATGREGQTQPTPQEPTATARAATEAATSEETVARPSDYTPALREANGNVIAGQQGEAHTDIKARQPQEWRDANTLADADNQGAEHGFVDAQGNFQTREQVASALGEKVPMQSERLSKLQAEAKAREASEQPRLSMGPGAARAEEIPEAKTVSIKNAKVDKERATRGELPMMQPARKAMGKTWDEGMQRVERNQDAGKELVDAIRDGRKKDVSAVDHAVLLHEKIRIMNERDMEAQRILDPNTADTDRVEARARWAALEDRVNEIDQATQAAGTISGRALQFRQALARDDYTFAGMERKARAAKGGTPLTPEESTRIKAQADRIAELEKRVEELQTKRTEKEGTQAADESVKKLRIEADKGGKRKPTDIASTQDRLVNGLKKRAAEGDAPTDVGNFIQQLALNFVRSGIKEREPLIDAVHGVLKDIFSDIERSQTRDAISGYGDFKQLDKEPAKAILRQLKGEMQQIGKIQDMESGIAPKKTGVERREPSDEERRLIREVNELKKKGGFQVTDPATQLKSALDSVKTRLRNQIRDLDHSIATQEPIVSQRKGLAYDAEAEQLRQRRDALKEQYEGIFGKKEMTDEQRLKMATSAAMRSEQAWIDRLDSAQKGVFDTGAKGRTVTSPEIESIKSHIEAIKAEVKTLHDIANPAKTPEEIALQSYKTRTANRIAVLQDKLARDDFSKTPRRELKMDADALRLKEQAERLKLDFDRGVAQERLKNRTLTEEVSDTFAKWRRGFLLSSPITLAKLTSAAIQRMTITPIEEFVGAGYGKLPIFSDIASKAPREGGLNAKAEAKAFTQGFTKGMKDAWDVLRTGKSELDVLYGKRDVMPREAIDFIGSIHGALKTVTKRNEFARSLEKRATQAIAEGVDVSDPLVQSRLALDAYKDANRSIFMQDNRVVAAYKRAVAALEQPDKSTGKPTFSGKAGATAAKVLLPIVKVPTNIVAETFQYALGSVTGLGRTGRALVKGIDTLRPEEADLIMRDLKKGSLGAAVLLLGYFNADKIGGYYQPGQKRKEGDVKFGSVRVFGHDVPSFLIHNPLLEVLQLGATVRRVADSKLRKKDTETQGISSGLLAGGLGLAEEVPFVREMAEVSKAFDSHSRGAFIGEMAKSIAIPQALQWTAAQMDKRKGETIPRKPEGVVQHIEMGIPGLRQKVPEKEQKGAPKPLRPLTPRPLVPSRIRP